MYDYYSEKEQIKEQILNEIDYSKDLSEEELIDVIDKIIVLQKNKNYIEIAEREALRKEVFYAMRRWDIIQELMEDPEVTEIMVNGLEHIFIEKKGSICCYHKKFNSLKTLHHVIQQMAAGCNRIVNESSPILDARLSDGSRVNIVLGSVALNGPVITIRRFPGQPITMDDLIRYQAISQEVCEWLKDLVSAGYNILVSGGTGSGKTTFLNVLSGFIPSQERIITIEDNAELQIKSIPNLVKLEVRNANVEGCKEITIRDLIKTSLRMRPDRVVIGEVRGAEAIDLLQALNTGHKGSMSTVHANSAKDSISRLETMVLMGMELPLNAIRRQIAAGIDIIIHLGRLRDRSRRVLEIAEVKDYIEGEVNLNTIYRFIEDGVTEKNVVSGKLQKEGHLIHEEKLKEMGIK